VASSSPNNNRYQPLSAPDIGTISVYRGRCSYRDKITAVQKTKKGGMNRR
jgi:hypothetical protein